MSTGRSFTTSELRRAACRRAAVLASQGFLPGDAAFLAHGNNALFFMDLFAVWQSGGVAVPIGPDTPTAEIERLRIHSKAKFFLAKTEHHGLPEELTAIDPLESSADPFEPACSAAPEETSLLLYTSGSTGDPKAVAHSRRSLTARISALQRHVEKDDMGISLCVLPVNFGHGLVGNSLLPLMSGGKLVIHPPSGEDWFPKVGALIDEHKVTFMSSVPALWEMFTRFADKPKSGTLKRVHCASAMLAPELHGAAREWAPQARFFNVYGMTETASWVSGGEHGDLGPGWGAKFEVRSDQGDLLPVGEVGNVWVRTEGMMKGYFRDPALTSRLLHAGAFDTGDIGLLSSSGNLSLVGRRHTVINTAGLKVHPEEIDAILRNHGSLSDVCAFPLPHEIAGAVPGVAVVFAPGKRCGFRELESWCRKKMLPHKVPAHWFELKEIPRDDRGKVNRKAVAAQCLKKED